MKTPFFLFNYKGEYMVRELFAKNLKSIRQSKGDTQETLAQKCNVSASYIAHVETKGCNASIGFIEKICQVYAIMPEQLFKNCH